MTKKELTIPDKYEKIFQWEYQISQCDDIDLSKLDKEEAKRAFRYLKKELGENFLKEALLTGHPLIGMIINTAPWTRRWFITFAQSLKNLKEQENYEDLLKRIINSKTFEEASSVFEIARRFAMGGFKCHFHDKIEINSRQKFPDIKLTCQDTNEEIYCEITALKKSRNENEANERNKKIFDTILSARPFMHTCCRLFKVLSIKRSDVIVSKIKETIVKANDENSFQKLIIDGVIIFGVAPEADKMILEEWASQNNLKIGHLEGSPLNIDPIYRVKRKIFDKQLQLPTDFANILIIYCSDLFFYSKDIKITISELEESIYDFKHILAVVIVGGYIGNTGEEVIMKDQHIYFKKVEEGFRTQEFLVLLNGYCEFKISPSLISKIYSSLRM